MKVLNNKLACLAIAIILLFTGMCSQIVEADSFFVYNPAQPTMEVRNASGCFQEDPMSYTKETLSSTQDVLVLSGIARGACVRGGNRISMVLSAIEIPSQILFIYLLTVGAIICKAISNEAVILKFIHHQDGEK